MPEDVVCLVKKHISDGELSQRPLLVVPAGHASRVPTGKQLGQDVFCAKAQNS